MLIEFQYLDLLLNCKMRSFLGVNRLQLIIFEGIPTLRHTITVDKHFASSRLCETTCLSN